jgi:predicted ribosome quality control (RQC) complex YloA/Tae2 family protein
MIRHLYTLEKLAAEFKSLEGCVAEECFTQEKNSFAIVFTKDAEDYTLYYSSDPRRCAVFLRERYARARKNTLDIFSDLTGKKLSDVRLIPNDRIMEFDFGDLILYLLIFGGPRSNAFLTDRSGKVIESLKRRADTPDEYHPPKAGSASALEEFDPETSLAKALARCDLFTGGIYSREICHRMELPADIKLGELNKDKLMQIYDYAVKFRKGCENSEFALHLSDGEDVVLSLAPLEEYPESTAKFRSVSEAVRRLWVARMRESSFEEIESEILPPLKRERRKISKKISGFETNITGGQREQKYRHYAELLIAQPSPHRNEGDKIVVNDWDGTETAVPLDPKLSLMENAGKYFEKAKKSREESEIMEKRLPGLREDLGIYESVIEKIESAETVKELKKIKEELIKKRLLNMKDDKNLPENRFRTFELGAGYTLYVGKNAANNDELTIKFAKPHDLWFHARGAGGSHAVLRLDRDDRPPKQVIEKAAAIAAYYSQAKNSKYAPVAYTQKKYVRKPKGANPGSVTISREKVVMVEPGLPDSG